MMAWESNKFEMKIGVLTTFYGYKRGVLNKVKSLIKVFQSLNLCPFIQLHSEPGEAFDTLVSELNELKKEFDVTYSVHQSMWLPQEDFFLNLGSSDANVWSETVKSLKRTTDFAIAIEARNVSFHAGYAANQMQQKSEFGLLTPVGKIPYETAYFNVRRGLEELLDYTGGDVQLSVENLCYRPERRYLFSLPEDFEHLVDGINVLFDVGHAYYSEKKFEDTWYIKKMIEIIGGKITEMHVSDNNGLEDEHKLVGHGSIPFIEIFKQICTSKKMPSVIIEAAQRKHQYSDDDLKNSIGTLKKILSEVET